MKKHRFQRWPVRLEFFRILSDASRKSVPRTRGDEPLKGSEARRLLRSRNKLWTFERWSGCVLGAKLVTGIGEMAFVPQASFVARSNIARCCPLGPRPIGRNSAEAWRSAFRDREAANQTKREMRTVHGSARLGMSEKWEGPHIDPVASFCKQRCYCSQQTD